MYCSKLFKYFTSLIFVQFKPMQRLSSIGKKKEKSEVALLNRATALKIEPNNEILLEMCKSYCRAPPLKKFKCSTTLKNTSKLYQTAFTIDIPYVFDFCFNFYVNLKKVTISNSRCVLLKSFAGMRLQTIEFIAVQEFEISDTKILSLDHLIFRDSCLNPNSLDKALKFFTPKSLSFYNCKLKDGIEHSEYKIYSSICKSGLLSLCCVDSFISLNNFGGVIQELKLKKFYYKKQFNVLKYNALGSSFSYLVIKGLPLCMVDYIKDLSTNVEMLSVDSSCNLLEILQNGPTQIKYLACENINITPSILNLLPHITSMTANGCDFQNLCFYDFINKNWKTLRFFALKETQVPLDGIAFVKNRLSDCVVQINRTASLYIPKA